jgi:transcriptional regulator with XRE-family HTH domain
MAENTTSPLRRYLEAKKMTRRDFADAAGLDFSYVCRLVNGGRRPGVDTAFLIEKVTRGAVPVKAWRSAA